MATPKKKTPVKKTVSKAKKTVAKKVTKVVKGKKGPQPVSFESYGTVVFTILSLLFLSIIIIQYL